jgi:hypothetical protein
LSHFANTAIRRAMTKTLLVLATIALGACHDGHRSSPAQTAPRSKAPITEIGIAVPIAPGKTATWRQLIEELTGPRYAEYEASRKRFGLTAQTTFLQQTPMGDFAVIHLTGPDVHASFHAMTTSRAEWDVNWRELTTDVHGIDFNQGERVFPKVSFAYSMDSGDTSNAQQFMFIAPLGKDGATKLRALAPQLMGPRHDEYVRARTRLGIHREAVFVESTVMGDAAVFYWLADDPKTSLQRLATSTDPFDVRLRAQAEELHPIPLTQITAIASRNELIGEYPHRVTR